MSVAPFSGFQVDLPGPGVREYTLAETNGALVALKELEICGAKALRIGKTSGRGKDHD